MTTQVRWLALAGLLAAPACAPHDGDDAAPAITQGLCVGGSSVEGVDVSYS